jgi:hypothetical protein
MVAEKAVIVHNLADGNTAAAHNTLHPLPSLATASKQISSDFLQRYKKCKTHRIIIILPTAKKRHMHELAKTELAGIDNCETLHIDLMYPASTSPLYAPGIAEYDPERYPEGFWDDGGHLMTMLSRFQNVKMLSVGIMGPYRQNRMTGLCGFQLIAAIFHGLGGMPNLERFGVGVKGFEAERTTAEGRLVLCKDEGVWAVAEGDWNAKLEDYWRSRNTYRPLANDQT